VLRLFTLGRLELQRQSTLTGNARPAGDPPNGAPSETVVLQPKRLAILAYLALSAEGIFHRRDMLLALFWPERDHTAARHALRHAVYHLRNVLGDGVLVSRGNDEIGLTQDVWSDARAFEDALRRGRAGQALMLHRGEFFDGVFVDGVSSDWEEWVSRTRARLRARAAAAAWTVADAAIRSGDVPRGLDAARRARELDPDNEAGLQQLMRWLNHFGRRPAALQVFGEFTRRVRVEYQAEPSPGTKALAEAICAEARPEPFNAAAAGVAHPLWIHPPSTWRRQTAARRRRAGQPLPVAAPIMQIPVSGPMSDTGLPR
jgi:DNA-binding SARP family transcriptional activator